jgi:DnaJ-class molecular chaperone
LRGSEPLAPCRAKAYKRAALRFHPDKVAAEEREAAEKKFKQVGAAVAILSDEDKRRKYDAGACTP